MSHEYDDIDVGSQEVEIDSHTRLLGALVHLSGYVGAVIFISPLGPLIFWLVTRENHPFLDDQGKEALNFQISVSIYSIITAVLCLVLVGFVLIPLVGLFWIIVPIIAAIKANSGEWYRYPLTIRLVQ